jgi:DNA-binding HxlR family transcriptional regulator
MVEKIMPPPAGSYRRPGARRRAASDADPAPGAARLALLMHHRWSPALLAELLRGDTHPGGCKFITLVNRLNISRGTLKAALDHLIHHDLVMRNPGVGHPMRPEYLLAEDGHAIAPRCRQLLQLARERGLDRVLLRKWSLAVIVAMDTGLCRFGQLKASLRGITSRALTLTLKQLGAAGLVHREVVSTYPPSTLYRLSPSARRIAGIARGMAEA